MDFNKRSCGSLHKSLVYFNGGFFLPSDVLAERFSAISTRRKSLSLVEIGTSHCVFPTNPKGGVLEALGSFPKVPIFG